MSATQHPAEMPEFTKDKAENEQVLEGVDTRLYLLKYTLVHWHPDVTVRNPSTYPGVVTCCIMHRNLLSHSCLEVALSVICFLTIKNLHCHI